MSRRVVWPMVSLCLLGGIAADRVAFHLPAGNAEQYHERVRLAADAMPRQVGTWSGTDIEALPAAVKLLKPNVIRNRRYVDVEHNQSASLLLVHCRDARDLLGHYPPVCYPAHGWTQVSATPCEWQIGGQVIQGMQYRFVRESFEDRRELAVDNFMLLPGRGTARDMQAVQRAAKDPRRRIFGAAQVQLVTDAGLPQADRQRAFETLVEANMAAIQAICAGGQE